MRRLNDWTYEDIVAYNLRDGGTAVSIFADTQTDRITKARQLVANCLGAIPGRAVIWELGCSAGDIAGYFSTEHDTYGIDIVPAAVAASQERYPLFNVGLAKVESVVPAACDILILTEFLEHVFDPIGLAMRWMPLAKHTVIGHPIVGNGTDPEPGHVWAYTEEDYANWWEMTGYQMDEAYTFSMGYEKMLLGRGHRL